MSNPAKNDTLLTPNNHAVLTDLATPLSSSSLIKVPQ